MGTPVRRRAGLRAPIRRAPRRGRVWARDFTSFSPIAAAGSARDLINTYFTAYGTTNAPPGSTVGGIMLDFVLVQTNARAASEDHVTLGIIVTNEVTAAEVPRPDTEPHADWLWWQQLPAPGAAAGASYSTAQVLGGPIRIRAKRRIQELGQHLWLVAVPTGLTTYSMTTATSTLMLMP